MWITFAFLSALFAGLTSILAKLGIKNIDSDLATAIRVIVILIFSWIMVGITNGIATISLLTTKSFIFLILSGLATGGSWLCYFKALQMGNVNKVVPIDKSSTILTMILAFIILKEPISVMMFISIILIGLGTLLMIQKQQTEETNEKSGWIIYAILSAVFASLTSILAKIGIDGIDSNLATAIRTVVVVIFAWGIVFAFKKQSQIKHIDKQNWLFLILSGITTGLSWLFYYRALQDGKASVVVPIDKLSIVVTVAFAYIWLKEKLSKKQFLGFISVIIGTLLLCI